MTTPPHPPVPPPSGPWSDDEARFRPDASARPSREGGVPQRPGHPAHPEMGQRLGYPASYPVSTLSEHGPAGGVQGDSDPGGGRRVSDTVYGVITGVIAGAMVGVVGTLTHRSFLGEWPVGIAGSILLVLTLIVFTRSLGGRPALAGAAVSLWAATALFALSETDRIVVLDTLGSTWIVTAVVAPILGMVIPSPVRARSHQSRFDNSHHPGA